jgi:hypothetical protein
MKIVITENQLKVLKEAVGVPDYILDAAEKLYEKVESQIKSIKEKKEEYKFNGELNVELGDKKKIRIDDYNLTVNVEVIDGYDEKPQVTSMAVMQMFGFDRDIYMKRNEPNTTLTLTITFVASEDWETNDLYEAMEKDKIYQTASLAHEIKHKYDKQAKETGLIGPEAEYQATQRVGTFGIPAIDHKFFRYAYFISMAENLVRPVEVASQMRSLGVKKSQFRDFIENERVYKELVEIKNYTFDNFIGELYEQMNRVDALLDHINEYDENMSEEQKISRVLEVTYISVVNTRMEIFVNMTEHGMDDLIRMGGLLGNLPSFMKNRLEGLKKTDEVRDKFLKYTMRFKKDPIKFFENECEHFNYTATKILKRIGKIYSLAQEDEVNESIINWELHQKLMEKKYGKRKIETEYKYRNFR